MARQENLEIYKNPNATLRAKSFQNHDIHIREHSLFLNQKYQDQNFDTFALTKLEAHIGEHKQLILKQMKEMAMAMQAQQQPPVPVPPGAETAQPQLPVATETQPLPVGRESPPVVGGEVLPEGGENAV